MPGKRFFCVTLVLMMSLALAGCVTPAGTKNVVTTNFVKSINIDRPQLKVWGDVLEWITMNGLRIADTDREAGVITIEGSGVQSWVFWPKSAQNTELEDKIVSCGEPTGQAGLFSAQFADMSITGNILIREKEGQTFIAASIYGSAQVEVRNGYGQVVTAANARCNSRGVLEAELFEYLKSL